MPKQKMCLLRNIFSKSTHSSLPAKYLKHAPFYPSSDLIIFLKVFEAACNVTNVLRASYIPGPETPN